MALLCAATAGGAAAQTCTDPVAIPDDNLKRWVLHTLTGATAPNPRIPPTSVDVATPVTCAQMASLTRLDAHAHRSFSPDSERIASLEGLQFATSLTSLRLQNNRISDLSPLSGLSNLRYLFMAANRISDLTPLRGLTSLEELTLEANRITDLTPLSGLTSMEELYLSQNEYLRDIGPLRNMARLRVLVASGNRIEDVSPLQGLTSLTRLTLDENRIEDISPLAANTGVGNSGDSIFLRNNPLNDDAATHIATIKARGVGDSPCWAGCLLWDPVLDRVQGLKVVPQGTALRVSWALLDDFAPTTHTLQWRENAQRPNKAVPLNDRFFRSVQNNRFATVPEGTSHGVSGLSPDVLYGFRVRAEKTGTNGDWSEEATGQLLPKVEGVRVEAGGGSLAVTWTAAGQGSGVDGYRVEWKSGDQGWDPSHRGDSRRAKEVSGTRHTIDGLAPGVEVTVRVRAIQGDEGWGPPSDLSDEATGQPLTGDLRPAELRLTAAAAALEVRWGAWCAATTWLVEWKAAGEDYDEARRAEVSGTRHTIAELAPGVEYTVRVTPRDGDGCEPAFVELQGTPASPLAAGFATAAADVVDVSVSVQEGRDDRAQLTVVRLGSSDAEVVIRWRTEDLPPSGSAGPSVAASGAAPAAAGNYVPARAGEDYTAVADGRLTIRQGQASAMLTVEILDEDRRIEPLEAFRVRLLSDPSLRIGVATAIVEIVDNDVAPQRRLALRKVLAGAGGRIAAQALEAIENRPGAGTAPQAAIGGQALVAAGERAALPQQFSSRAVSARELLTGSSFDLPLNGTRRGGESGWRVWAQAAATGFDSRPRPGFRMDGEIVSGFVGAERRVGADALVGLALSHSEGDVDYTAEGATTGAAGIALTGLLPYAHWNPRPELGVWGALGIGWGGLDLEDEAGAVDTGLRMHMAAAGLRRGLAQWRDVALAVKADAFLTSMKADAAQDLPGTRGDASRLRLRMEGSRAWQFSEAERAELGVDLGGRRDGGDATSGLGLELGANLEYADARAGLALGMDARYLLAHRERLEEWSAALNARLDPGAAGLGPWLAVAPQWRQRQGGLDLDLGYGLPAWGGAGLLTPYAGLSLGDREGWKLGASAGLGHRATLNLEGAWRGKGPQVALSAALRW